MWFVGSCRYLSLCKWAKMMSLIEDTDVGVHADFDNEEHRRRSGKKGWEDETRRKQTDLYKANCRHRRWSSASHGLACSKCSKVHTVLPPPSTTTYTQRISLALNEQASMREACHLYTLVGGAICLGLAVCGGCDGFVGRVVMQCPTPSFNVPAGFDSVGGGCPWQSTIL